LDLGKGADTVTIEDLKGSIITGIHLNLGRRDLASNESLSTPSVNNAADGADDTVLIKGTSSSTYNDSIILDVFQLPAANSPTGDPASEQFVGSGEYWSRYRRVGLYQVTISNSDRNNLDDLTVETFQGADNINASAYLVNKLALTLRSGAGNDILIGSPFADVLDSGTGSDTVTGGPGVDEFFDASGASDTDALVELLNRDMSLFNNYFVSGKILADDGGTLFKSDRIVEQTTAPANAAFPAPIVNPLIHRADVYRSSDAEIERLLTSGGVPIFERASLQGGTANNVLVLGDRDNTIYIGSTTYTTQQWTGVVSLDNGPNGGPGAADGDGLNEYYILNLTGTSSANVSIVDSGQASGFDELVIYTTNGADKVNLNAYRNAGVITGSIVVGNMFGAGQVQKVNATGQPLFYEINSSGQRVQRTDSSGRLLYDMTNPEVPVPLYKETTTNTGAAHRVMVSAPNPDRDDITFREIDRVQLHTLGGDDGVESNDTGAGTAVYLGSGNDTIVIGFVPQINDAGNTNVEYPFGLPIADTNNMTNGNSHVMSVYGEEGNDEFEVNHNKAEQFLNGGNGDDTFVINTFLTLKENPGRPEDVTNLATLFGGDGANRYSYLQNAPVTIAGGPGNDTIVINGTAIGDVFVVTDKFAVGAGRIVYFTEVERIEVNGASGGDEIYVMSSDPNLTVVIRGGSGNDKIHLGGEHPITIFDPPAFIYQPPSYQVQDPPVQVWENFQWDFSQFWISYQWNWYFNGFSDAGARAAITNYINALVNLMRIFLPHLELTTDINTIVNNTQITDVEYGFGDWWIFDPEIYIRIDLPAFDLRYRKTVIPELRTVTPDPIEIDPPPFAFKLPGKFNVSDLRGKVIVDGGDAFESTGDELFVHNSQGAATSGNLTSTSLSGLGLGQPVDIEHFEKVTILLGDGNDTFTIDGAPGGNLTVSTGGGNDTINIKAITGPTDILAGAGDDTFNVGHDVLRLNGINNLLTLHGNDGLTDLTEDFAYDPARHDPITSQVYIRTNNEDLSNPNRRVFTDDGGIETVYPVQETARVISNENGKLGIYIVELDPVTGRIETDKMQERNSSGQLLYRDNVTGNRTTSATFTNSAGQVKNNFPSLIEVSRQKKTIANKGVIGTTTGSGTDTLNIRNDNDGSARSMTLGSTVVNSATLNTVTSNAMTGSIRYQGLESVVIRLGNNADTVTIDTTHAGSTTLHGNSGNDTFNVSRIIGATTIHSGNGNDTVLVSGAASGILDTVHGLGAELTVNGDSGSDTLTVNDTGDTSGDSDGVLTGTRLTGLGMSAGLTYGTFETFNINLGSGHDSFRIDSTHAASTFVRGGLGNDTVNVRSIQGVTTVSNGSGDDVVNIGSAAPGSGGNVDGIAAVLTVNGETGNDSLNVDETGDSNGNSGQLTGTELTGLDMTGSGKVVYGTIETLNLNLSGSTDVLTIAGTHSSTTNLYGHEGNDIFNIRAISGATNLFGGAGSDTFNAGSAANGTSANPNHNANGTMNAIVGVLSIEGNDAGDTLNVDDTGDGGANTGQLTSTQITGMGIIGTVNYTGLETLNIGFGPSHDTLNIRSTHSSTVTSVNTGSGANTVHFGSIAPAAGGNVDSIAGKVIVNGQGNDTIFVDDTGDASANTGYLTASTITGLDMAGDDAAKGIEYSSAETLIIGLGTSNDTFHVRSTYSGTLTNLRSGAGTNTINISSNASASGGDVDAIAGRTTIVGEGTDTLNVDDTADSSANSGTLTSSRLTGLDMAGGDAQKGIEYLAIETLNLHLGSNADTLLVESTHTGLTNINGNGGADVVNVRSIAASTNINGGAGNDVINVGSLAPAGAGNVNAIAALLTVNGGSDSDTLNVDDTGDATGNSGHLTSTMLTGLGMSDGIQYSAIELLDVQLGSGDDVFTIDSTHAAVTSVSGNGGADSFFVRTIDGSTTLNGGSGNDMILVSSIAPATGGTANGIRALLTVNGDADSDAVTVDDTQDGIRNLGELTSTRLTGVFAATGSLTYGTLEVLNISLGNGGNVFTIHSTHGTAAQAAETNLHSGAGADEIHVESIGGVTNVNAAAGNDLVDVGSHTGTASQVLSSTLNLLDNDRLNLLGESGSDVLSIYDSAESADDSGTLVSNLLTGFGMDKGVAYEGFEVFNLTLGTGKDTLYVESTHAGTVNIVTGSPLAPPSIISNFTVVQAENFKTNTSGNGHQWALVTPTTAGPGGFISGGTGNYLQALTDGRLDSDAVNQITRATENTTLVPVKPWFEIEIDVPTDGIYDLDILAAGISDSSDSLWFEIASAAGVSLVDAENILSSNQQSLRIQTRSSAADGFQWTNAGLWSLKAGKQIVRVMMRESGAAVDAIRFAQFQAIPTDDTLNLNSISGVTTVHAGDGNDLFRINVNENGDQTFQNGIGALLTLHGEFGSDRYIVNLAGQGSALINVIDQKPNAPVDAGNHQDWLTINGTDGDDHFLLRPRVVAAVEYDDDGNQTGHVERVNYDENIDAGLVINGREGDDEFVLDDNSIITTINGDGGNDTFQVGQMFLSPRGSNAGLAPEDQFETILTSRGYLSNGVSQATTLNGGDDDDSFTVYHNIAALALNGDNDNDRFTIRAFVRVDEANAKDRIANVNGGQGANFVAYAVNAPVAIDGGGGVDTVVIIGTEFGDDFVITAAGTFGGGLFTQYVGIEELEVDGGEGNDTFFILSTSENIHTIIRGGLGNDTIKVGGGNEDGSPISVVSNDLQGHNGVIVHSVESGDLNYDGIRVEGISANVGDNEEPAIVLTPSGGFTRVFEPGPGSPAAFLTDSYTVVLTRRPNEEVRVTIVPQPLTEAQIAAGMRGISVNSLNPADTQNVATTLTFTPNNWFIPQTVTVRALDDAAAEGTRFLNLSHTAIQGARPADGGQYDGAKIAMVLVQVVDDDAAGVVITPVDAANTIFEGTTAVAEKGAFAVNDSYQITLTKAPAPGTTVTVTLNFDGAQLQIASPTLTFTSANWNVSQFVTVTAVDDAVREGLHYSRITHSVSSSDPEYHGIETAFVDVTITDDDAAGVVIRQTGGGTGVIEVNGPIIIGSGAVTGASGSTTLNGNFGFTVNDPLNLGSFRFTKTELIDNVLRIPDLIEIESNDSILTAQNIDGGAWTLAFNPDVGDSRSNTSTLIPHLTIAGSGNESFDYYRFTVSAAGTLGIFDIDYGYFVNNYFDSYLRLYKLNPDNTVTLIAVTDDSSTYSGNGGSSSWLDSYLEHRFADAGQYILEVSRYPGWYGVPNGVSYKLQVSIENHPLGLGLSYNPANGVMTFTPSSDFANSNTAVLRVGYEIRDVNNAVFTGELVFNSATIATTAPIATNIQTRHSQFLDLAGMIVEITAGKGAGQSRVISSANTDRTQLTVTQPWLASQEPNATSQFRIRFATEAAPISDTYSVVLTSRPTADVRIDVLPELTRTYHAKYAFDASRNHGEANQVQVSVDRQFLIFTPDNWDQAQTVRVTAIDDTLEDGGDAQVFADPVQRVNAIRGPLTIDGGLGDKPDRSLNAPVLLPSETNVQIPDSHTTADSGANTLIDATQNWQADSLKDYMVLILSGPGAGQSRIVASNTNNTLTVTEPWTIRPEAGNAYFYAPVNPNTTVDEAVQVDTLTLFNADSVSDDLGVLTRDRIYGLGMGPDTHIAGKLFRGGITYRDLEAITIHLGSGNDTLTIESTFSGTTTINAAGGQDTVNIRTIAGHTIVNGGHGADTINVGTNAPLTGGSIDEIGALLTIDGGTGEDVVNVDDRADAKDNTGLLTQTTLTGLDMSRISEIQTLTVRADGGAFVLTAPGYAGSALIPFEPVPSDLAQHLQLIQSRIRALFGSVNDDIRVTREGATYIVTFGGTLAGANLPKLEWAQDPTSPLFTNDPNTTPDVRIETARQGTIAPIHNAVQTLTVNAVAGSFRLSLLNPNTGLIEQTSAIPFNASAEQFLAALDAVVNPN
ncbi:MAG: hypothetical protein AB1813_10120, partial [Verrucomicrobiota bacterium]